VKTRRLTMAQRSRTSSPNSMSSATDARPPFSPASGNLGHGNIAGVGQALQQQPAFRYYLARNEQAMVHISTAFARMNNRMRAFACTSSIGPGATKHDHRRSYCHDQPDSSAVTPGDIFARRNVAPCSSNSSPNTPRTSRSTMLSSPSPATGNRINRPDHTSIFVDGKAMRVLTPSQLKPGPYTLALPRMCQAEAWDLSRRVF